MTNVLFFIMTDVHAPERRSYNMSRIRSKGNKTTELMMIKIFKNNRITGWRRHQKLPGNPDFSFRKEHVAIFIDGCFWHGCKKCYHAPLSNTKYWKNKLKRNLKRDRMVKRDLEKKGWTVIRIWEHSLKNPKGTLITLRKHLE
jgi:DNA mismatch endonuclease (patch repair protein)